MHRMYNYTKLALFLRKIIKNHDIFLIFFTFLPFYFFTICGSIIVALFYNKRKGEIINEKSISTCVSSGSYLRFRVLLRFLRREEGGRC